MKLTRRRKDPDSTREALRSQRNVLPIASIPCGGYNRPIEMPHLETFPGAARLPTHRAAMLKSGSPPGVRRTHALLNSGFWLLSSNSSHSSFVFFFGRFMMFAMLDWSECTVV